MRQWHECAVVKEGNRRVGFFVKDNLVANKDEVGDWVLWDAEYFHKAVKDGNVDYLGVNENGSIITDYTEEDLKMLRGSSMASRSIIEMSKTNYFDMDVQFKYSQTMKALSSPYLISLSLGSFVKILGVGFCTLYGVCREVTLAMLDMYLKKTGLSSSYRYGRVSAGNMSGCVICLTVPCTRVYNVFMESGICAHINVQPAKWVMEKGIKLYKVPIFGGVSKDLSDRVIKVCESINSLSADKFV